jgi:hypothetical protein
MAANVPVQARVYRPAIKRQIEQSLTLTQLQKHGFRHPANGGFLMLPAEYDVMAALEPKSVALVVLAVMRRTLGEPGDGPHGRKEWVQLSVHAMAAVTLLSYGQAHTGITQAVRKGYLLRRRVGQSWAYAVRFRGMDQKAPVENYGSL